MSIPSYVFFLLKWLNNQRFIHNLINIDKDGFTLGFGYEKLELKMPLNNLTFRLKFGPK